MDSVEIAAGRLRLRPPHRGDADWVCRACQDPEIQRWTRVPRPYLAVDAVAFVTTFTSERWDNNTGAVFGVFDSTTGEGLGTTALSIRDPVECVAEVGFWVAPWARKQGVATQATLALARWAFGAVGVWRLEWLAEVGNTGSRAVADRAGFTFEGVLRDRVRTRNGARADAWLGSLLASDLPG